MDSTGDGSSRKITAALAAAATLRRAARLSNPARRADAVWAAVVRLRRGPPSAVAIVNRLEDDGHGDMGIPGARLLMASARDLDKIVSTAYGLEVQGRPDSGRVRSRALRADGPTTIDPRPHRRGRRRARRGRRQPR
jgi:hypothetical protein